MTDVDMRPLEEAVQKFAGRLLEKLKASERKYGWNNGWLKDNWKRDCQQDLWEHVRKGDPLDVAAYCLFMDHHGWPTAPTHPAFQSHCLRVAHRSIIDQDTKIDRLQITNTNLLDRLKELLSAANAMPVRNDDLCDGTFHLATEQAERAIERAERDDC